MIDCTPQIRARPMIIPRGTFLFAFLTLLETGITYSAPINSQNAVAVAENSSEGFVAIVYGCETTCPVPSLSIPISPMMIMEPTRRNATRSWIFANISTPRRFAIMITMVMISVYAILGTGSLIVCAIA